MKTKMETVNELISKKEAIEKSVILLRECFRCKHSFTDKMMDECINSSNKDYQYGIKQALRLYNNSKSYNEALQWFYDFIELYEEMIN